MQEVVEFLTGGRVQVWPVMSSQPWYGRILATYGGAGFTFQSDEPEALAHQTPAIFVTWASITHINRMPEEVPGH